MRTIRALIKPNSKKGPLVERGTTGSLILYVREPAIDGKANNAAIALLATYLSVPKTVVQLKSGATGRYKTFVIHDTSHTQKH